MKHLDMEFLVFGEDWGRHPSSTQHILTTQFKNYDVIWINSIGLRQPTFSWRDLKRISEKIQASIKPPSDKAFTSLPAHSLKPTAIIKPLVWPLAQNAFVQALNNMILKRQLRPKKKARVIWAALPSAVDYLKICDSDLVIYYCGDDFSALADVDHDYATQAEQKLIARADIILACSPSLKAKFPKEKTWLLPHGVSLSQFAKPASNPEDIDNSRPSVGFYGSLNDWLDQDLLLRLAKARPNINFYLLGPIQTNTSKLLQRHNIHLLPAKPHHQLASYLQHWTMAILPFKDNAQIRACNPLKLREYLAAGCPIISSDFPAVRSYHPIASIATSNEQWLSAIDHYCHFSTDERQAYAQQAQNRVSEESWEQRANLVTQLIKEQLMYNKSDVN
ncbi:glycosyltransferase [uncultured Photobacterium sp.]|uniref:glycosyltransferase family protein n=1 Tax=uncultured Photobacterium sp. TaxID=173973 RepID=UPI002620975F|nr:glycosyltransferase [uncultured Photobacterium sp.]